MAEESHIKVHVELPNHWAANGESLWARPLGGDLYELRNVPFYAYGLNFLDVIEARANGADAPLCAETVVRRSGHRTVRILFHPNADAELKADICAAFGQLGVTHEQATDRYYALDVSPHADPQAVRNLLDQLEATQIFTYETCEERIPGSFDHAPR